jgi:hypothetical protein
MKKNLFLSLTLLSFFACIKKDDKPEDPAPAADNVAPVIVLNGKAKDTINAGTVYIDPGAIATDNVDGNISSEIVVTGTVNTLAAGDYSLAYNVKDDAGNSAVQMIRLVRVNAVAVPLIFAGNYAVACTSNTENPGVDPTVTQNSNYNTVLSVSNGTVVSLSTMNIGPVTGAANNLRVNGSSISSQNSPVNAPAQTFAYCTGTISSTKTSFTLETKYFETMYPNKFYQVTNVFTKQ